ncbi:MAG: hypothetical protein AAGF24_11965 [Cyanobacteria bacterium P01_H01_bin.121]
MYQGIAQRFAQAQPQGLGSRAIAGLMIAFQIMAASVVAAPSAQAHPRSYNPHTDNDIRQSRIARCAEDATSPFQQVSFTPSEAVELCRNATAATFACAKAAVSPFALVVFSKAEAIQLCQHATSETYTCAKEAVSPFQQVSFTTSEAVELCRHGTLATYHCAENAVSPFQQTPFTPAQAVRLCSVPRAHDDHHDRKPHPTQFQ